MPNENLDKNLVTKEKILQFNWPIWIDYVKASRPPKFSIYLKLNEPKKNIYKTPG